MTKSFTDEIKEHMRRDFIEHQCKIMKKSLGPIYFFGIAHVFFKWCSIKSMDKEFSFLESNQSLEHLSLACFLFVFILSMQLIRDLIETIRSLKW